MSPVITFEVGDLTLCNVDAVVNAANSALLGGGGVDGAIHSRGGPAILAACREIRRTTWQDGLPTGEAVATTGGDLKAPWVIHTVGPVYGANGDRDADLLASCHRRSLEVAVDVGARSIAFPAISCGVYGYLLQEAAPIAVAAAAAAPASIEEVRFVLFDQVAFDIFRAVSPTA